MTANFISNERKKTVVTETLLPLLDDYNGIIIGMPHLKDESLTHDIFSSEPLGGNSFCVRQDPQRVYYHFEGVSPNKTVLADNTFLHILKTISDTWRNNFLHHRPPHTVDRDQEINQYLATIL
jgi:hypothetical protein